MTGQKLNENNAPIDDAFDCVMVDSDVESQFAHDCSMDERVRFFFKLPSRFRIPTPLGTYNPDWAVVFENDARVYFVAETKSSTVEAERRASENMKIKCGRRHFSLADNLVYKDVARLAELID
jgi:type III restriction enzyme